MQVEILAISDFRTNKLTIVRSWSRNLTEQIVTKLIATGNIAFSKFNVYGKDVEIDGAEMLTATNFLKQFKGKSEEEILFEKIFKDTEGFAGETTGRIATRLKEEFNFTRDQIRSFGNWFIYTGMVEGWLVDNLHFT